MPPSSNVQVRLFKLRVFDSHCHVVASHDDRGEPVEAPGVDLRGADASAAFEAASEFFVRLTREGAGAELRAVSVHLERKRIIATFETREANAKPTVLRIDDGEKFAQLSAAADPVIRHLGAYASARLAARRAAVAPSPTPDSTPLPILQPLEAAELRRASAQTLGHYDAAAEAFWHGTRDHDVSQNVDALLRHLPPGGPHVILDFGCGPGRDLITFRSLGHAPIGLDGAKRFVEMARSNSGCEVLHQDFLALRLPEGHFAGVFANASLFHVPSQELPRVLRQLHGALDDGGVLFASNPRGPNHEGWSGDRYGCYLDLETFRRFMTLAGFDELEHYYRPHGEPRERQPWLASTWRKRSPLD